jgi:hypothetical protein
MRVAVGLIVTAALLSGCGETRAVLGLNRNAPDEFVVVDRAPLVLPPDFQLRPPQPGAPRPQEQATSTQAEAAMFGQATEKTAAAGALEQQLLNQTGAGKTAPNIRQTVDREAVEQGDASRHLADDLLWWRKPETSGAVVDQAAETARLRGNQAAGKPANAGATPVIEKRKSGWLGL